MHLGHRATAKSAASQDAWCHLASPPVRPSAPTSNCPQRLACNGHRRRAHCRGKQKQQKLKLHKRCSLASLSPKHPRRAHDASSPAALYEARCSSTRLWEADPRQARGWVHNTMGMCHALAPTSLSEGAAPTSCCHHPHEAQAHHILRHLRLRPRQRLQARGSAASSGSASRTAPSLARSYSPRTCAATKPSRLQTASSSSSSPPSSTKTS